MSKLLSGLVFTALLILAMGSVNAAYAKTVVNGIVYNADFTQKINGAQVTVTCDGISHVGSLTDSQGAYAIVFDSSESCGIGSTMSGEAVLGDKIARQSSFQIICGDNSGCNGASCQGNSQCLNESIIVLLNFGLGAPVQPPVVITGGGNDGSSFRYPDDYNTNRRNLANENKSAENQVNDLNNPSADSNPAPAGLARITGAVIGALGGGTGIILVVIFVLAGSFIALRIVRNRRANAV